MATFNVNDTARRVQYTSSGQSSHTFNFQVNAISETQVHKNDTLLTEATHYNTSLNADGTGTITFTSGNVPTSGDIITIIGDQPLSRTGVYSTGQVITPTALETDFDNVVIRQQQLKEITDRSVSLKPTTPRTVTGTGTNGPLYFPYSTTSANSGKIIRYNAAGTSLELGPDSTSIDALAAITSDLTTLAGISANITTVAGQISPTNNLSTVAGLSSQISTLGSISGLSTLAANSANVTTAAQNAVAINTAATNITAIQNASTNATNAAASATAAAASAASAAASSGGGSVKVTTNDTSPSFLNHKLLVSGGLTKTVGNAGGNETLTLTAQAAEIYGFKKSFTATTSTKTVTVQSVGGSNKYFIDGIQQEELYLFEGNTYIFDHPSGHPFRFSTDSGNSSAYTTGVTVNSSTKVTIVVAANAPTLYYYCSSHSNMGGVAYTPVPANNTLQVVTTNGGQDNITSTEYNSFIQDPIFAASGITWSISSTGSTPGEIRATI
jgi:hypothetical protein